MLCISALMACYTPSIAQATSSTHLVAADAARLTQGGVVWELAGHHLTPRLIRDLQALLPQRAHLHQSTGMEWFELKAEASPMVWAQNLACRTGWRPQSKRGLPPHKAGRKERYLYTFTPDSSQRWGLVVAAPSCIELGADVTHLFTTQNVMQTTAGTTGHPGS